jgi:anti-sigma-K factor RskA
MYLASFPSLGVGGAVEKFRSKCRGTGLLATRELFEATVEPDGGGVRGRPTAPENPLGVADGLKEDASDSGLALLP